MTSNEKRPIVVKRIKKVAGGAHGGAWKIAYADFVTAMMAFFLLMWLLGSTGKHDLESISEYFKTPLSVAIQSMGESLGNRDSIIKGGGKDLTRSEGMVKKGDTPPVKKILTPKELQDQILRQEKQKELERLKELKKSIEMAIDNNTKLLQSKKQILLDMTTEGLRIQILDEKNRPMFQIGSAKLEPYTKDILHEIASMLNQVPNKISLSGHTDAQQYAFGEKGYSNWELSADRANASRRELIAGGISEDKMVRVVGLSSAVLFDKSDPLNPTNRRISIIVMNKKAEEAALNDGGIVEAEEANQGAAQLPASGVAAPELAASSVGALPTAAKH